MSLRILGRRAVILGGLLAAMTAVGATTATASGADDPLKVGFVYVGPVGDFGWSHQHDQGRQAVEAEFGDAVETAFFESVTDPAEAERVIGGLAADGYDLIFATSFAHMNATLTAARAYPDVVFENATGQTRLDNVATYAGRFYEGRYVIGIIAGLMTETNTVGYVAAMPIPEMVRSINAFTQGLRSVNPEAVVRVRWVNAWYDPEKERAAAEGLLSQGADVLAQDTDSPVPVQVAEENGVYAFGQALDMSRFGPNAHLTAVVDDWSGYYIARTRAAMDGTWTSTDTWGGLDSGMVRLADYNPVLPAEVVEAAEAARTAIAAGDLHPLAGPLRNQIGQVVIPEGAVPDDETLLSMDWLVEGVLAKIPE
jgi:simple sugar transport system substrate-binding protein